jgi:hypothetical protein
VHHQVQKLGDVRFERTAFRLRALGRFRVSHGLIPGGFAIGDFEMATQRRRFKPLYGLGSTKSSAIRRSKTSTFDGDADAKAK